jgi:hypothetical protein
VRLTFYHLKLFFYIDVNVIIETLKSSSRLNSVNYSQILGLPPLRYNSDHLKVMKNKRCSEITFVCSICCQDFILNYLAAISTYESYKLFIFMTNKLTKLTSLISLFLLVWVLYAWPANTNITWFVHSCVSIAVIYWFGYRNIFQFPLSRRHLIYLTWIFNTVTILISE